MPKLDCPSHAAPNALIRVPELPDSSSDCPFQWIFQKRRRPMFVDSTSHPKKILENVTRTRDRQHSLQMLEYTSVKVSGGKMRRLRVGRRWGMEESELDAESTSQIREAQRSQNRINHRAFDSSCLPSPTSGCDHDDLMRLGPILSAETIAEARSARPAPGRPLNRGNSQYCYAYKRFTLERKLHPIERMRTHFIDA